MINYANGQFCLGEFPSDYQTKEVRQRGITCCYQTWYKIESQNSRLLEERVVFTPKKKLQGQTDVECQIQLSCNEISLDLTREKEKLFNKSVLIIIFETLRSVAAQKKVVHFCRVI